MRIGDVITAESTFHVVEGTVVAGRDVWSGEWTTATGTEIDDEGTVHVREDDGTRAKLNGWMWTFRTARAVA